VRWEELADEVPFVPEGAEGRSTVLYPHLGVSAQQPGKYRTRPPGGDFAVAVGGWRPRHVDKFELTAGFTRARDDRRRELVRDLYRVIHRLRCPEAVAAASPLRDATAEGAGRRLGYATYLALFQCIGLAEERRYPTREFGGGRYLPLNFARLVAEGWVDPGSVAAHEKAGLGGGGLSSLERQVASVVPADQRWRLTSRGPRTDAWARTVRELQARR
jgi:hypothetical protein